MRSLKKNWILFILIFSIASITIAYIAEFIYGILPCKMCLYQRYIYYILIIVSIFYIFLNKNKKYYFLLVGIVLLVGIIISLWHLGIENKIIPGPSGCSIDMQNVSDQKDLKKLIIENPVVSCNQVNWSIFGISFVFINFIMQLALFVINTIFLVRANGKK